MFPNLDNILIVDDVKANLVLLTSIIKKMGLIPRPVLSMKQALEEIDMLLPQLILLNLAISEGDGYQFCIMLKERERTKEIPIILLLCSNSLQNKINGYKLGAVDFITKPFEAEEVKIRVNIHLQLFKMKNELELYNRKFHKLVYDQIQKFTDNQRRLVYSLIKLFEIRSNVNGIHPESIRTNIRILATSLHLSPKFSSEISDSFIDTIDLAATLYDVGKLTIQDSILLKPDKLGKEEMEIMKTHTEVGANTLREIYKYNEENEFIKMAIDIANYHHEKWNGKGYPSGLSGKDIPLAARIMTVVDAYDALTTEKCYRPAYTNEDSIRIMNEESGISFDPDIMEVFNKITKQLKSGTSKK